MSDYLEEAKAITASDGARGRTYGNVSENFNRIAELWTSQLGLADNGGLLIEPLTSEHVAMLMIQLKLSRLTVSRDHADSWIDIAGYVNCISIIHSKEN